MAAETSVEVNGTIFTYSPKEQSRLKSFEHLVGQSIQTDHWLRKGYRRYFTYTPDGGTGVYNVEITSRWINRMNYMAFHMYEGFMSDERMKTAADLVIEVCNQKYNPAPVSDEKLQKMWDN